MTPDWTDTQPIYRQLRDKIVAAIVDHSLPEGEALPSVRTLAVDLQINPLTASKAYQVLVTEGLVEKRRGLGMFVMVGARDKVLESERSRFLQEDWPRIVDTINRLGFALDALLAVTPSAARPAGESGKNRGEPGESNRERGEE